MGTRWRTRFTLFSAAITGCFLLCGNVRADPTLVVDVDDGSMAIHVGATGLLPKPILAQSGGDGGTTLTAGNWGPVSSLSITSLLSSLNMRDTNTLGDILPVILGSTAQNYSEALISGTDSFAEPMVFPLALTYNSSFDARDIDFISLNGKTPTNWNTLYIGEVPEPSSLVMIALGVLGLTTRRRWQ